jgi:hypothetical protein
LLACGSVESAVNVLRKAGGQSKPRSPEERWTSLRDNGEAQEAFALFGFRPVPGFATGDGHRDPLTTARFESHNSTTLLSQSGYLACRCQERQVRKAVLC